MDHRVLKENLKLQKLSNNFGIHKTGRRNCVAEHDHEYWELVFIDNGKSLCSVGKKSFHVKQGSLVITPPGLTHKFISEKPEFHTQYSIGFDAGIFSSDFTKSLGLNKRFTQIISNQKYHIHVPAEYLDEIEKTIKYIYRDYHVAPLYFEQSIISRIEILVLLFLRFSEDDSNSIAGLFNLPPFIYKALWYIEEEYSSINNLEDIICGMSISTSYFIRLFKTHVGFTPLQYLNRTKIEKSCDLLLHTPFSVTQIAMDSGFPDLRHFNRLFKRFLEKNTP